MVERGGDWRGLGASLTCMSELWVVGTWSGETGELWARSKNPCGKGQKNKFSVQAAQKQVG